MSGRIAGIGIVIAAAWVAGGCALLPDPVSDCDKPRPYQSAREVPPLRVPEGATLPDKREALQIPVVTAPEAPPPTGRCLEHPPSYGGSRPPSG